uniref:Zinc finger protein 271-like n=1 Tax=Poecilia reticulata TaxID=8081 RepID=A0A3P9PVN4_POERE
MGAGENPTKTAVHCPTLPLSALRLLVSPIRLVSAAIWHTVEQKIVSDYGLLEEFVFMVTEIVPQLLSTRQRAELILGLRARLILELCRSDETADLQIIQPHLDRMQSLRSLWKMEVNSLTSVSAEVSDSHFMGLVQNLLRDPDERMTFFQDVFPGDFGPTYDKAIQTLMWLFLSRLEKLLPAQSLHGILSALCLPPVERVVIVNEQPGTDAESSLVYTVCSEMEVESENKEVYVEVPGSTAECAEPQWFGISGEVKAEIDSVVVSDPTEGAEASEGEMVDDLHDDHEDFDADPLWERPVRKNRGLKMKRYLSQWRKSGKTLGGTTVSQSSAKNDLDERTCKVCGKVVTQAKFLQRHMNQHTEELPIACSVCKKFYKSLRFLQQHKCTTSTKVKPDKDTQGQETTSDAGEQSSSGVICEAFIDDHPPDSAAQHPDYIMSEKSSGELGERSPDGSKSGLEGPFYCPHCSVEFKCRQTFRFHMRNICYTEQQVDPENPDDVKHCFRLRDSEALAMHKESHTPFQCNRCEEHFPVFKALHKHYIDAHNPTEPFTCPYCDTTFSSLKRFIRHEWKHTGYQPFQCTHCAKRFRSYSDLVEHQKKHTKAYPYLCWECGKKFRHGVTLTRHVERVHHAGERVEEIPTTIFPCTQCDKTFTSRRCLLKHDNFHHKGMRFPCEHCGKGFFGKDALVRHTLIHTDQPYNIAVKSNRNNFVCRRRFKRIY